LYEALAKLVADRTIAVPVSRQFARALRHQFARPEECRDLRDRVLELVGDTCGQARDARAGV
jgi:hypothetical protein